MYTSRLLLFISALSNLSLAAMNIDHNAHLTKLQNNPCIVTTCCATQDVDDSEWEARGPMPIPRFEIHTSTWRGFGINGQYETLEKECGQYLDNVQHYFYVTMSVLKETLCIHTLSTLLQYLRITIIQSCKIPAFSYLCKEIDSAFADMMKITLDERHSLFYKKYTIALKLRRIAQNIVQAHYDDQFLNLALSECY